MRKGVKKWRTFFEKVLSKENKKENIISFLTIYKHFFRKVLSKENQKENILFFLTIYKHFLGRRFLRKRNFSV